MNGVSRQALVEALDPRAIERRRLAVVAALEGAAQAGNLLIVGSSALPQKIAGGVHAVGGRIEAFVEFDPRYWGREVAGLRVLALDEALALTGPDPVVIVGVWSPDHVYEETRAWLESKGIRQILPANAAFWAYAQHLGPHYQFGTPMLYGDRRDDILRLYDCLADQESKDQYAGILHYRLTLDPSSLPKPSHRRIYFDPSVSSIGDDAVVADVGAYSGDTLSAFLYWHGTKFARFVAFEPDRLSFQRLAAFKDALPKEVGTRIECVQAAVAGKAGTLRFSPTGMPGTRSSDTGTSEVPCVTIDDFFASEPLDYLKLDVEGAESEVLAGAWQTIMRTRPIIGLSAYHTPDDVFALPLRLVDKLQDYEFRFRAHDFDGIDFICYAVPRERSPRPATAASASPPP